MFMEEIQKYFNECKEYWISMGDSAYVATRKSLWWDCAEVWNIDKSWYKDDCVRLKFFHKYIPGYIPYTDIPDEALIKKGAA